MIRRSVCARAWLLVPALVLVCAACSWPQFRGDAADTGNQPFETKIGVANVSTLTETWTSGATGGEVFSSPAVANGVVYVGSSGGKLYAFSEAATPGCFGDVDGCPPLWTAQTGGPVNSSPAVANGVVYVGSDDHNVYAFDDRNVVLFRYPEGMCATLGRTDRRHRVVVADRRERRGVRRLRGPQALRLRRGRQGELYSELQALFAVVDRNHGRQGVLVTGIRERSHLRGFPRWQPDASTQTARRAARAPRSRVPRSGPHQRAPRSTRPRRSPTGWSHRVREREGVCVRRRRSDQLPPHPEGLRLDLGRSHGGRDLVAAVANGVVYVGAGGSLYAFDGAGKTKCSLSGVGPSSCAPVWTAYLNDGT